MQFAFPVLKEGSALSQERTPTLSGRKTRPVVGPGESPFQGIIWVLAHLQSAGVPPLLSRNS